MVSMLSQVRSTKFQPGIGAEKPIHGDELSTNAAPRESLLAEGREYEESMKLTDIAAPDYFHKVVDCQWACPAHTPVPEYIRLISAGRYGDAYMVNWKSNVFPGILGRTCDRPCEPAGRRGRGEKDPGAGCRAQRGAAALQEGIRAPVPEPAR